MNFLATNPIFNKGTCDVIPVYRFITVCTRPVVPSYNVSTAYLRLIFTLRLKRSVSEEWACIYLPKFFFCDVLLSTITSLGRRVVTELTFHESATKMWNNFSSRLECRVRVAIFFTKSSQKDRTDGFREYQIRVEIVRPIGIKWRHLYHSNNWFPREKCNLAVPTRYETIFDYFDVEPEVHKTNATTSAKFEIGTFSTRKCCLLVLFHKSTAFIIR